MKKSLLLVTLLLSVGAARADLPDEIQVYDDDLNQVGESGVELHVNTTPKGRSAPAYRGEVTPRHGLRVTPEFSYGWTETLEAGLYLPFIRDAADRYDFAGPKLRLKWVPRKAPASGGWFLGLNGELAYVQRRFEAERMSMELRPIVGYRNPDWLVAFNPVLSYALRPGYRAGGMAFSPALKVGRTVAPEVQVGFEYYTDLGKLAHVDPYGARPRTVYAVVDAEFGGWGLNLGVGKGLNALTDTWTVKAIFAIPFGR